MKFILIRHGSTRWNEEKKYCGITDTPLSKKGLAQARKLKKFFKDRSVDIVYSSDRKRAIQTARIIFGRRDLVVLPGLKEIHFGDFEGKTHKEILQENPVTYRKWLKDPFTVKIPGGESMRAFKKRVLETLKQISLKRSGSTVAIVCHGGVIGQLICHIKKSGRLWKNIPRSASMTIIKHGRRGFKIIKFND